MALAHEKADVDKLSEELRALFTAREAAGGVMATILPSTSESAAPPPGWKRISFIRHGEGYHNVAQREWREAGKDGEPYTLDTDPEMRYEDPLLTARGEEQARELQARAAEMTDVELIIVSPMRRATQTALIGFESAVAKGVPVIAEELCHEHAGKHTCDKRKNLTKLVAEFPLVDYKGITSEEDPYWGDGMVRETHESIAERGAAFVEWLLARKENKIVIASHSAWLMTMFNAVVEVRQPQGDAAGLRTWFGTGEMRTVIMEPRQKTSRCRIL